jgi:hypothetical protein
VSLRLPRRQYADLYGPTVGDRVRLADTDLLIGKNPPSNPGLGQPPLITK